MKKTLSLLLSMLMLLSVCSGLSFTAQAATTVASGSAGNTSWALDSDGVITITGSGQRIPDYYDNSPAPWYNYREQIKKAVIGEGVVQIGARAFKDCTALTEVDFGTIDTLGDHAFYNCTSLRHAFLPDNCTWIWSNAFENCTGLQSAYINYVNSYESKVPDYMFQGCTSLAVLGLGTGIHWIGTDALKNCTALTAIISDNGNIQALTEYNVVGWDSRDGTCGATANDTLVWHFVLDEARLYFTGAGDMATYSNGSQPWQMFSGAVNTIDFSTTDGTCTISATAFQGREAVETVDFTNVRVVGYAAFAECTALKAAHFDSVLTNIYQYAFQNDTAIDQVTFQTGTDGLYISDAAFRYCSGTTYWLNFPSNLVSIGADAFFGTNLNYVKFATDATVSSNAFGDGQGGYTRFFCAAGGETNIYTFVKKARSLQGYNWWYFCGDDSSLNVHEYAMKTVAPTCTEQGYDVYGCQNCDESNRTYSNYVPALGHRFRHLETNRSNFTYECTRCGVANLVLSASDIIDDFSLMTALLGSIRHLQMHIAHGRAFGGR